LPDAEQSDCRKPDQANISSNPWLSVFRFVEEAVCEEEEILAPGTPRKQIVSSIIFLPFVS